VILPVARRELRAAARNPRIYVWRVRVGIIELLVAAVLSMAGPGTGSGRSFWFLAGVALVFCLLDGLRKAADSVSVEKREGTLGLLFLSGIGGFEVVLGKLISALVRSMNGLLAFVPILALTLLLGGTTGAEFWRVVLVLVATLTASTALCLLVSALSTEESAVWALAVLAALCALPPLVFGVSGRMAHNAFLSDLAALSPIVLFNAASASSMLFSTRPFWMGIGGVFLVSVLSLFAASRIVRWSWRERDRSSTKRNLFRGRSAGVPRPARKSRKRDLLDINPYYWLAFNPRQHRIYLGIFIAVLGLFAAISGYVTLTGQLSNGTRRLEAAAPAALMLMLGVLFVISAVRVASQSSSMLVEARRSGFLELSIGTPIRPADILKGQWAALRRTIVPILFIAAGLAAITIFLLFSRPWGGLIASGLLLIQAVLLLYLLGWVGIWMALSSKTAGRAFFKTLVIGLVAPNVVCSCGLPLPVSIILLVVARRKARSLLSAFFSNLPAGELSAPPLLATGSPPVIR
jgi:ABC-type transport system involved in multi-copper enzyme maturation permease subunit